MIESLSLDWVIIVSVGIVLSTKDLFRTSRGRKDTRLVVNCIEKDPSIPSYQDIANK